MTQWQDKPLRDRLMSIMDAEANETAATIGEAIDALDKAAAARSEALEEAAQKVESITEYQRALGDRRLGFLVPACPLAAAIRELKGK